MPLARTLDGSEHSGTLRHESLPSVGRPAGPPLPPLVHRARVLFTLNQYKIADDLNMSAVKVRKRLERAHTKMANH